MEYKTIPQNKQEIEFSLRTETNLVCMTYYLTCSPFIGKI
jgi:hypothetical protein